MSAAPGEASAEVRFATEGDIADLDMATIDSLMRRNAGVHAPITDAVAALLERVRTDGDAALVEFAERFDGVRLGAIEVPMQVCERAAEALEPALRDALEQAAGAIRRFHRALLPRRVELETAPGVRLTRIVEPLGRVGVYAPGGRAAYPSSVLMGVIPARIAGVGEIVVCSPPASDGLPPAEVLAACALAGCDRVFAIGGAGAVAAMTWGTATVPVCDRIVGPGNAWVTEAKRQVTGVVATDCPAGPSEAFIVADASADPHRIAAELVAQAEHDRDAAVILVAVDADLLPRVRDHVTRLLDGHPRRDIAGEAIRRNGALLSARTLDDALAFASRWAPEHLLLAIAEPDAAAARVTNAGTIFLGQHSSITFGDYVSGANHVLPTAGLARSFSGLDTSDFVRRVTIQRVTADAAARLAGPAGRLADAEGLPGHAHAARLNATRDPLPAVTPGPRAPAVVPRTAYAAVSTYDPARRACATDLSDNTNLFGSSDAVLAAVRDAVSATLTRYPSVYGDPLKAAFASVLGIGADCVVTGCGSDDVIDSAIRAFCEPGDILVHEWPTFGIVPTFARMNAATPEPVLSIDGCVPDANGLLSSGARMMYLCRPGNPSGASCERGLVASLIDRFTGVILIDEAYADFAGDTVIDLVLASGNAVVLRTLSKAWGLAGMRIGFAVGPPALVREIEKSRGPYKVGRIAEQAGVTALREGRKHMMRTVAGAIASRDRLGDALVRLGWRPVPSKTNFILLPVGAGRAGAVADVLFAGGVAVRPFAALPGLGDCIRITVGPWPMMQAFLDALRPIAPPDGPA